MIVHAGLSMYKSILALLCQIYAQVSILQEHLWGWMLMHAIAGRSRYPRSVSFVFSSCDLQCLQLLTSCSVFYIYIYIYIFYLGVGTSRGMYLKYE